MSDGMCSSIPFSGNKPSYLLPSSNNILYLGRIMQKNNLLLLFLLRRKMLKMKNMLKNMLLVCLLALPGGLFAQAINRAELLDKTWYFVAMKCPDKVTSTNDGHYIKYFSTMKLTAGNVNNLNYGTYEKTYKDSRDNPRETGTYSITTDEVGNVILTLKKAKTGTTAKYVIPMVETNHLTLVRMDEGDKCNTSYAIAP